ncbi:MAG: hypothetical protein D6695_11615 [Planctomycetota bacterium]|nr:MAG: hypothetical protein D6695_11615 [Planctomycetota bacterium]
MQKTELERRVAKKRQLALFRLNDPDDPGSGYASLGTVREFIDQLAPFNTAPDGSPPRQTGTEVLHGPGIVIEYASNQDEVRQAILTVVDQDVAWPVLSRLCKTLCWKMQDLESGQVFG